MYVSQNQFDGRGDIGGCWTIKLCNKGALSNSQKSTQTSVTMYIILAGLAAVTSVSIVSMFYVQRKASRRQRSNVEEPEVEEHEEDKSTLLGAEIQEAEDKE